MQYVPSQLLLLVYIDKDHSRLNCNVVCQPRLTSNSQEEERSELFCGQSYTFQIRLLQISSRGQAIDQPRETQGICMRMGILLFFSIQMTTLNCIMNCSPVLMVKPIVVTYQLLIPSTRLVHFHSLKRRNVPRICPHFRLVIRIFGNVGATTSSTTYDVIHIVWGTTQRCGRTIA